MDVKIIKDLATKYSVDQLLKYADELENTGKTSCPERQQEGDLNAVMSDFLQSSEVKKLVDSGMQLNEAVREFSKRVREVLA